MLVFLFQGCFQAIKDEINNYYIYAVILGASIVVFLVSISKLWFDVATKFKVITPLGVMFWNFLLAEEIFTHV